MHVHLGEMNKRERGRREGRTEGGREGREEGKGRREGGRGRGGENGCLLTYVPARFRMTLIPNRLRRVERSRTVSATSRSAL